MSKRTAPDETQYASYAHFRSAGRTPHDSLIVAGLSKKFATEAEEYFQQNQGEGGGFMSIPYSTATAGSASLAMKLEAQAAGITPEFLFREWKEVAKAKCIAIPLTNAEGGFRGMEYVPISDEMILVDGSVMFQGEKYAKESIVPDPRARREALKQLSKIAGMEAKQLLNEDKLRAQILSQMKGRDPVDRELGATPRVRIVRPEQDLVEVPRDDG